MTINWMKMVLLMTCCCVIGKESKRTGKKLADTPSSTYDRLVQQIVDLTKKLVGNLAYPKIYHYGYNPVNFLFLFIYLDLSFSVQERSTESIQQYTMHRREHVQQSSKRERKKNGFFFLVGEVGCYVELQHHDRAMESGILIRTSRDSSRSPPHTNSQKTCEEGCAALFEDGILVHVVFFGLVYSERSASDGEVLMDSLVMTRGLILLSFLPWNERGFTTDGVFNNRPGESGSCPAVLSFFFRICLFLFLLSPVAVSSAARMVPFSKIMMILRCGQLFFFFFTFSAASCLGNRDVHFIYLFYTALVGCCICFLTPKRRNYLRTTSLTRHAHGSMPRQIRAAEELEMRCILGNRAIQVPMMSFVDAKTQDEGGLTGPAKPFLIVTCAQPVFGSFSYPIWYQPWCSVFKGNLFVAYGSSFFSLIFNSPPLARVCLLKPIPQALLPQPSLKPRTISSIIISVPPYGFTHRLLPHPLRGTSSTQPVLAQTPGLPYPFSFSPLLFPILTPPWIISSHVHSPIHIPFSYLLFYYHKHFRSLPVSNTSPLPFSRITLPTSLSHHCRYPLSNFPRRVHQAVRINRTFPIFLWLLLPASFWLNAYTCSVDTKPTIFFPHYAVLTCHLLKYQY
ncbi:putative signal peptide protein [Puccinia sorghi]|uniref:Putative signal peptide protein n=1 Tax=Puccinia sorghi TaxID=27349 RepID=A0A0L6URW0_9BASI|nr:putative signal peptide protein [Puccinia sorghi]